MKYSQNYNHVTSKNFELVLFQKKGFEVWNKENKISTYYMPEK